MGLRDEITKKVNRLEDLEQWLEKQKNKAEWYDIIDDLGYSNHAIAKLLEKHGFQADHNHVYRLRNRRGTR